MNFNIFHVKGMVTMTGHKVLRVKFLGTSPIGPSTNEPQQLKKITSGIHDTWDSIRVITTMVLAPSHKKLRNVVVMEK